MAYKKDNDKSVNDRHQSIITELLKDEDNKYCVDCDGKGPRWASWNLGVFLCIRCAGIHRNLGVHISKVKSVNLDTWTPQQIAMMKDMGNSRGRAVYEANLPDNFRRPQINSALEQFIRAKYEHRRYIAEEFSGIKPDVTSVLQELQRLENTQKKRPLANCMTVPIPPIARPVSQKSIRSTPNGNSLAVNNSLNVPNLVATDDIIKTDVDEASSKNDLFGDFFSSNTTPATDNKVDNANDLFGLKINSSQAPSEKVVATKESIMALFGQQPSTGVNGWNIGVQLVDPFAGKLGKSNQPQQQQQQQSFCINQPSTQETKSSFFDVNTAGLGGQQRHMFDLGSSGVGMVQPNNGSWFDLQGKPTQQQASLFQPNVSAGYVPQQLTNLAQKDPRQQYSAGRFGVAGESSLGVFGNPELSTMQTHQTLGQQQYGQSSPVQSMTPAYGSNFGMAQHQQTYLTQIQNQLSNLSVHTATNSH